MIQDGQKQKQDRTGYLRSHPTDTDSIYTYGTATLAGKQAVQHHCPVTSVCFFIISVSFLLFAFIHSYFISE
jgi:hypothetical protein